MALLFVLCEIRIDVKPSSKSAVFSGSDRRSSTGIIRRSIDMVCWAGTSLPTTVERKEDWWGSEAVHCKLCRRRSLGTHPYAVRRNHNVLLDTRAVLEVNRPVLVDSGDRRAQVEAGSPGSCVRRLHGQSLQLTVQVHAVEKAIRGSVFGFEIGACDHPLPVQVVRVFVEYVLRETQSVDSILEYHAV